MTMRSPPFREACLLLVASAGIFALVFYLLAFDIQQSLGLVLINAAALGCMGTYLLVLGSGNRVKCRV